jgi:hypothetical protein
MIESSKTGWKKTYESLKGSHPQCVTFDPNNPDHAYCGTLSGGLWKTNNDGQTWDNVGNGTISSSDVMSVSVNSLEREGVRKNSTYVNCIRYTICYACKV